MKANIRALADLMGIEASRLDRGRLCAPDLFLDRAPEQKEGWLTWGPMRLGYSVEGMLDVGCLSDRRL